MAGRRLLLGAAALAVLAVAVAFGGWYAFMAGDDPPPVSLDAAVDAAVPNPRTPTAPGAERDAAAGPAGASASGEAASAPSGRWTIAASSSFVGYRVREELAGIGASTAVGRTSAVTGELRYDGASVTAVSVLADLRELKSDDSRRDNALRRQALETSRFPEAKFELAEPVPVTVAASEGARLSTTARGDLTIHGVTRRVDVPVEGRLVDGRLVVVGSLEVAFADYSIARPTAPAVLSVEDRAVVELQLVFVPAAG